MSEKGGPVIMVALLFGLFWLCSEPAKDPTQCDLLDSSPLIEQVATVKESFTVQPKGVPDAVKDAAVSISLARSLAENHIADANKMVDPQPSPSDKPHEAVKREILVFLAPKDQKCEPCDRWKRCEMQRFMDAKWEVAIFDEPHSYGRTPTFEIKSGDKKATLTGYTTLEQAAEAVR
jgi:hypothetical protein